MVPNWRGDLPLWLVPSLSWISTSKVTLVCIYLTQIVLWNSCFRAITFGTMETKRLFVQCLSDTSIHGFRYTVDRQLKVCENVLWTVLTFGFLSMGIYLVHVSILLVFQFQNLMKPNYDFMAWCFWNRFYSPFAIRLNNYIFQVQIS